MDSTGNGNNGTYSGALVYGQPGAIANDSDTAIAFNGGLMNAGAIFAFMGTSAFTLEAWVKRPQDTGYHSIIAHNDRVGPNVSEGYGLLMDPSGAPPIGMYRLHVSNGDYVNAWGATWTSGWTHVVATYDTQTLNLYLNGVNMGSMTSSTSIGVVTEPFVVGTDTGGTQYQSPFEG